jgi:hypothetical protein
MSPEQVAGRSDALDGRSDEYAMGLILFELVTLGPAVGGRTVTEVVSAVAEGRKSPMVAAVPGAEVPPALVAIVEKATAKSREDRYPGVAELAADVRRHLRDEEIEAAPDTKAQRLMRSMARHRRATLGAVGALLFVAVATVLFTLWRRQVIEEEARLREQRVERFLADVSRNAEAIDAHFLQLQGLLQGLAGAAEQALSYGTSSREPFATAADFGDPARRPKDAFRSKRYAAWVSGAQPVWAIPRRSAPELSGQIRRLVPLRRMQRLLFLESQGRAVADESVVPTQELLDTGDLPLVWTLLGLPSGLGSIYPGSSLVPDGWDPRERPWYRQAQGAKGPVWGVPHRDVFGTGLVLSCSVPLHDANGVFQGVAAADLSFDRVARSLLTLPGYPSVEECFLIDASGGILVRSKPGAPVAFDEGGEVKLERFPYALPDREKQPSGFAQIFRDGREHIVVWRELEALTVSYAVVADRDRLTPRAKGPLAGLLSRFRKR